MLITPGLAAFMIALKLLMGAIVGLSVTAIAFRARFKGGLALRGALLGGVAFLFSSGVSGWADSRAYFYNGQRLDVTPDGESLWLRNRLAEHELALGVASSCGAALLAGLRLKRNGTPNY
jgi:hypothetical protein